MSVFGLGFACGVIFILGGLALLLKGAGQWW